MLMTKEWCMPNKNTFSMKPIRELINKHINNGIWIDPFARNSIFNEKCYATNDLSEDSNTTHHMESLDFLNMLLQDNITVDGVLFDPPYSVRQVAECYKHVGKEVHKEDTQSSFYGNRKKIIAKLVKPGGKVLSFGWNSNGIGKKLGFETIEILLVSHGGPHNDTICTVEVKK